MDCDGLPSTNGSTICIESDTNSDTNSLPMGTCECHDASRVDSFTGYCVLGLESSTSATTATTPGKCCAGANNLRVPIVLHRLY